MSMSMSEYWEWIRQYQWVNVSQCWGWMCQCQCVNVERKYVNVNEWMLRVNVINSSRWQRNSSNFEREIDLSMWSFSAYFSLYMREWQHTMNTSCNPLLQTATIQHTVAATHTHCNTATQWMSRPPHCCNCNKITNCCSDTHTLQHSKTTCVTCRCVAVCVAECVAVLQCELQHMLQGVLECVLQSVLQCTLQRVLQCHVVHTTNE